MGSGFVWANANDASLRDYRIAYGRSESKTRRDSPARSGSGFIISLSEFLSSASLCDGQRKQRPIDAAWLREQSNAGQIAPAIQEHAQGSFTAPGTHQTIYYIKVGECLPETRNYFGTYRLPVFEGPRLIATAEPNADGIVTVADVNGDGIDELLLQSVGYGTGDLGLRAQLVSLMGGKLRTIRDFDEVYDNPCGRGENLAVEATLITYDRGGLYTRKYTAPWSASRGGNVPALEDFTPAR
jgi:hypothetical protein